MSDSDDFGYGPIRNTHDVKSIPPDSAVRRAGGGDRRRVGMTAEEFVYVEPFSTPDDKGLCIPYDDELSTMRGVVIGVLCGLCFWVLVGGLIVLLAVI